MTLKISARAVQELMAGRLSSEQFRNWSFGEENPVRRQIEAGRTISSVRFELRPRPVGRVERVLDRRRSSH
jgi:hypothetical protein